jgi:hypothetical protein
MEIPTKPSFPPSLEMAQEAIRRGDRQLAHQLCARLVRNDPANEQAWMLLVDLSESADARITALGQILRLNPGNATARQTLYETMQQLLRKDAFLTYQGETSTFYQICAPEDFQFIHPKDRAVAALFPPSEILPTQAALQWLGRAAIGLIPAGLGTLVCAPLAMAAAIKVLRQSLPLVERRRAWIVLCGAIILWLIAFLLLYVLILHLE